MEFKNRLRELREEKNLSQTKLANILQVSQSAVTKWECGRCEPTASAIITLAKFFNVSADYLLGLKDD